MTDSPDLNIDDLFQNVKQLIDAAKQRSAATLATEVSLLHSQNPPIPPDLPLRDPRILNFIEVLDFIKI